MRFIHLAYCPFTGLGKRNGFRGNTWLKHRIEVFKKFTLPSLLNQTSQNYILWVSWRPEEKKNKIVKEFYEYLTLRLPVKTVFTYNGVCFWDDVYSDEEAYQRLMNNLHETIKELMGMEVAEADWVYMTIQPSDDLFDKDAFKTIESQQHALSGWRKGYIMNYGTKEIAEYNPTTLPPFYTFLFPYAVFFNAKKHADFTGPYKSHEYIGDKQKYHELEGRGFCVGTHGENISTVFNHIFKGKVVDKEVLERFGVAYSEPVKFRKGYRLWFRVLVNKTNPKVAKVLKKIYYNVFKLD